MTRARERRPATGAAPKTAGHSGRREPTGAARQVGGPESAGIVRCPAGCDVVVVRANRRERREFARAGGRVPEWIQVHADDCPINTGQQVAQATMAAANCGRRGGLA